MHQTPHRDSRHARPNANLNGAFVKPFVKPFGKQKGAVLFVSLMFLILLTLIGLSAANVGILQERMAGNVRESNIAFQRAEATLRGIERRVQDIAFGGGGGLGTIDDWNEFHNDLSVSRGDCSLAEIEQGDSFDSVTWTPSPDVPASGNLPQPDYAIVELTGGMSGEVILGSACRPLQGEDSGKPGSGVYFMIMARAKGPAETSDTVVQSIYFWPI